MDAHFIPKERNKNQIGDPAYNSKKNPSSKNDVVNGPDVYLERGLAHYNLYKNEKKKIKEQMRVEIMNAQAAFLKKEIPHLSGKQFLKTLDRLVYRKLTNDLAEKTKQGFPELGDHKKKLDDAISDLSIAIQIADPADCHYYYRRGKVYFEQGEWNKAIKDFNQAIALTVSEPNRRMSETMEMAIYQYCAKAHFQNGNPQLALEIINQGVERFDKHPLAYYYRAKFYKQTGQLHLALADISFATSISARHFLKKEMLKKLDTLLLSPSKEEVLDAIEKNELALDMKIKVLHQIYFEENTPLGSTFREQRGLFECGKYFGTLVRAKELYTMYTKELNKKDSKIEGPHPKTGIHKLFDKLPKITEEKGEYVLSKYKKVSI